MVRHLKLFFVSQRFFSALFIFFIFFLGAYFLGHFTQNFPVYLLRTLGGLFFFVFGTGIAITIIVQWLVKRTFKNWEFISLSLAAGLIIPPAILEFEYLINNYVYDWFPIVNCLVLWIIAGIILFYKKTYFSFSWDIRNLKLKNSFFIVLIFGFMFTLIQIFMYKTLPDLDPYKWLIKYTFQFANQQLDYSERPLFGSLIFIGTRFTGINLSTFLKYVFPFVSLLALFPAWMIARNFEIIKKQFLFLLFVFTGPAAILYSQTPMPQAALIMLAYFILFFTLYALEKNDKFFFYVAGIITSLSFFFHQAGIIFFAIWIFAFLISDYKIILANKKVLILVFIIIFTNFFRLKPMIDFMFSWTKIITTGIFSPNNFNLLYPFSYNNVDVTVMGWGSLIGVFKFYAFHMGPIVGALLLLSLLLVLANIRSKKIFLKKWKLKPEIIFVSLLFFIFFAIAEILPRFPNIALLPDRAWIFAGIFSFVFLYLILKKTKTIPSWAFSLFLLFIIINLSGATYINYLKRYLITPNQLNSAQWIKSHLPKNRVFLTYGYKSLLPVYADSTVIRISDELFCSKNIEDYEDILDTIKINEKKLNDLQKNFVQPLNNIEAISENSLKNYSNCFSIKEKIQEALAAKDAITREISNININLNMLALPIIHPYSYIPPIDNPVPIEDAYSLDQIFSFDSLKERELYVYYSKLHKQNPYRSRPYEMTTWGIEPCPDGFLFDRYPNKFKRIYIDNDKEVIIWKILK